MKIHVGSLNAVKINPIREAVSLYPEIFSNAEVTGVAIQIEEFGHPKSLEKTATGAVNRAKAALLDADFAVGIEGGLLAMPFATSGFVEVTVCAIYDGKEIYIGLGPGFEWPKAVTELILDGKVDASQAFKDLGLTDKMKQGAEAGGLNGLLTNGRYPREECIKAAFIQAMVRLEKESIYN